MSIDDHQHSGHCYWDVAEARWRCDSEPVVAGQADGRPLVDVRDMIVVHTALLREFRLAATAVRAVDPEDVRRAAVVGAHLSFLGDLLHHHHLGEDELLWPRLEERVPERVAPLLESMHQQHAGIDAALRRVTTTLTAWTADAGVASRHELAEALTELHTRLVEHLDLEEREVLPLAASHLSESEWHGIGEAAVANIPKAKLPLAFGMFAYEGDPLVLQQMLRTAPPAPRILMPRIAPWLYARHARRIHGTATP
jgi:hemerythrin-like domain-containing protein